MTTQQPDALQCAADLEYSIARHGMQDAFTLNAYRAMKMVRTQHARIADLEAQLEAIGAGGVSGPLIGQPQAMPDLSQLTERGAKAWAGVDAQGLREGFTAADMATVSAQGFRDGVASVSAGSEPVATVFTMEALTPGGGVKYHATIHKALPAGTKLYTHPSPPEGMAGWTTLPGQMPEPNTPVLLDIGKKFTIRALWAEKHTVRVGTDVDDWGEYDEETDEYYCPEGWYEWNEHEEVHWAVSETPRAWRELPQPLPAAPRPC